MSDGFNGKAAADRRLVQLPPKLQSAKAAFSDLVDAVGGQEMAARETGKGQSRISAYGLRNTADFPPIDVVATLEGRTHGTLGHPHVTRWLARQAGYALVKLPQAPGGITDWHREIGAVSREVGEAIERICSALSDNKVTASEVRRLRIREEIGDAQERLAALDALAIRALEDGE